VHVRFVTVIVSGFTVSSLQLYAVNIVRRYSLSSTLSPSQLQPALGPGPRSGAGE